MKNTIESFKLFVRDDERSQQIARDIRELNSKLPRPLVESEDGDLVIAIGGDGTFIRAVTETAFSKAKLYTGIHTGTLGFLQDLSANDIFPLLQYINHEDEISTRKTYVSSIKIALRDGAVEEHKALNEVLIVSTNHTVIKFSQYVNGDLLHKIAGNGIIISSNTGDTAYSYSAGGPIVFSRNPQLVSTLITPISSAVQERFIKGSIVCEKTKVVLEPLDKITIKIDGREKHVGANDVESVEVTICDAENNYINMLDLVNYSKVRVVREKMLGCS